MKTIQAAKIYRRSRKMKTKNIWFKRAMMWKAKYVANRKVYEEKIKKAEKQAKEATQLAAFEKIGADNWKEKFYNEKEKVVQVKKILNGEDDEVAVERPEPVKTKIEDSRIVIEDSTEGNTREESSRVENGRTGFSDFEHSTFSDYSEDEINMKTDEADQPMINQEKKEEK